MLIKYRHGLWWGGKSRGISVEAGRGVKPSSPGDKNVVHKGDVSSRV